MRIKRLQTEAELAAYIARISAPLCKLCRKRTRHYGQDYCGPCTEYVADNLHPETDRTSLHKPDASPRAKQGELF